MLVYRQTKICDDVAVSVLIVWPRVIGIEPAGPDRIIEDVDLTVALQSFAKGAVGSAFAAQSDSGRTGTLFCKNLHNAGQRTRSIDGALRAADDFDSIHVVRRQIRKIKLSGKSLIDRNSIEQDLHILARQPAHEDRRQLPRRSSLDYGQPWNLSERVRSTFDLFIIDVL